MNLRAILLSLALAGCATVGDLSTASVADTFQSSLPVEAVSSCLQVQYGAAPIVTDGKPTFILRNGYQSPLALVTLTPAAGGTLIEMRRGKSLGGLGNWRKCGG